MRFILILLIVFATTPASAVERWTIAFAMGTTEAIIRNAHGADVNFYCRSGHVDKTPGIFVTAKGVGDKVKAGEKVAVQFLVDGKRYPFEFDEIQFEAKTDAQKQALSTLIDALTTSKRKGFVVEFPKRGVTERFSLLGARKAMTSAKEYLSGCLE